MHSSVFSCVLCAVLLFSPFLPLQGKEIPAGTYTYRQTEGDVSTLFYWKVEEQGAQRVVSVYEKGKSFINFCSADGATLQWQFKDTEKKNDIIAKRQGKQLILSGIRDGQVFEQTIALDDRPWYQLLSFSLKQFLGSERESMSFWMIRADTVEVTTLKAEKKGEEEIVLDGKKIPSTKVEVRAEGFYSNLWHSTYWFRKSDKLFLMYRSVQGLPGTAETVVELAAEPAVSGGNI